MRFKTTLLCIFSLSACVSNNPSTRDFAVIDNLQVNEGNTPLLVQEFSNLCLAKDGETDEWEPASKKILDEESLSKLKQKTVIIPSGGAPVEETQSILAKTFKDGVLVLEISQRFDRKRLTTSTCSLYGQQNEFLENCASLGKLLNRSPDQNTKYKESKAHFIGWNAALSGKQSRIKCQYTPNSPTLPYEGTQLSVRINHLVPAKTIRKSNPQRFDVSGR